MVNIVSDFPTYEVWIREMKILLHKMILQWFTNSLNHLCTDWKIDRLFCTLIVPVLLTCFLEVESGEERFSIFLHTRFLRFLAIFYFMHTFLPHYQNFMKLEIILLPPKLWNKINSLKMHLLHKRPEFSVLDDSDDPSFWFDKYDLKCFYFYSLLCSG
jgi:hypothetical protein